MERVKKFQSSFDYFEIGSSLVLKGEQAAGAVAFELTRHGFEVEALQARKFIELVISCPLDCGLMIEELRQHWNFMRGEDFSLDRIYECVRLIVENAKRSGGAVQ